MSKVYLFNEHGVCENPDVVWSFKRGFCISAIEVAQHNSKWYYGIKFNGNNCGCEYGVSLSREGCPTKDEVVVVAIREFRHLMRKYNNKLLPNQRQCFEDFAEKFMQLSLF